ncbi:Rho GDP-dissociation inhibitor 1 [Forsythia ovata]|uniref:Rho GDP-dissociation inhibitor 1 n=1 Tax=Forsythia ovata TaxID=205694 RepID=A0ABD1P7V0_9LAMI
MIVSPLTGKEEQKVDMNTMNEDVENRREKTKNQENNIVSSKQFKPYLGSQLSLKEQDEKSCSRKWRERLLGRAHSSSSIEDIVGADVRVLSLTIICPGRPEIVLSHPFVSTPKSSLFTLKEGTKYQLKFSFMVYNNVVSGLQYMNTLWKSGIRDQIGRKSHSQPSTVKTAEQLGRKTYFYPPSIQSLVSQIDKQRLQIDQFVTLQNDRLRLALEEQRKQQISYFLKKSQVLIQQKDEEIIKAVNKAMELEEFMKL